MVRLEYQDAEFPYFLNFLVKEDARGKLTALEFSEIPFQVSRYFAISVNDSGLIRGGHAHKECWQAFFACVGTQKILVKNLSGSKTFDLKADQLLIVPPYNWCEVRFNSKDSIMGVFASHPYDHQDYLITEPIL